MPPEVYGGVGPEPCLDRLQAASPDLICKTVVQHPATHAFFIVYAVEKPFFNSPLLSFSGWPYWGELLVFRQGLHRTTAVGLHSGDIDPLKAVVRK